MRDFLNKFMSHRFLPSTNKAIRVTPDSATALDNIYIRGISACCRASVIRTAIFDHYPVLLGVDVSCPQPRKGRVAITYRDMSESNMKHLKDKLLCFDWSPLSFGDVNHAYETFMNTLNALINFTVLLKTKLVRAGKIKREP